MIKDITFFETEEDLKNLTNLTHDKLWNAGFNLDDWDWGFVSDECYVITKTDEFGGEECVIDSGVPQYVKQILFIIVKMRTVENA